MRDGTNAIRHASTAARSRQDAAQRRARNKIEKLRRIKEAACRLFTLRGFDETTTREIASAAGVGLGTVFVYATNKRDLLFLVANEGIEEVTRRATAAISPDASLLDNLTNLFRPYYDFFAQQPAISRLVLREMTFYDEGAQAPSFRETRDTLLHLLGNVVELALERGMIETDQAPEFVGWMLFCVYQIELRRWIACDELDLLQGLATLRRALELVVTGLVPTPATPDADIGAE